MILSRLYVRVSPRTRRAAAGVVLDLAVLCWIVTAFMPALFLAVTFHISWLAIVLTALDWLATADVREDADDG